MSTLDSDAEIPLVIFLAVLSKKKLSKNFIFALFSCMRELLAVLFANVVSLTITDDFAPSVTNMADAV